MPEDRTPCRDFERGVCTRGDNCRYFHPEGTSSPAEGGKLPICKDYQNKECLRQKCKFLHITQEEEEEYNKSGTLPEHGGKPEATFNPSSGGQDICKDFLNGVCSRGDRCKFSHESEMGYGGAMDSMYGKRSRVDGFYGGVEPNRTAIMDENEMLKQKITGLQKEVIDLRQMNDTLYEQNAKYRTHLTKGGTSIATSQVNAYSSGAVTYPQYSQTAYPAAAMPIAASVPGVGAYSTYSY